MLSRTTENFLKKFDFRNAINDLNTEYLDNNLKKLVKLTIFVLDPDIRNSDNVINLTLEDIKCDHPATRFVKLTVQSAIEYRKNDIKCSLATLNKAKELFENLNESVLEDMFIWIFLYYKIRGNIYQLTGELNKALKIYQQSLRLAEKYEFPSFKAIALLDLGEGYFEMGEIDNSWKYHENALSYLIKYNCKNKIAMVYYNLGTMSLTIGNYEESYNLFKKSYGLCQEINYEPGLSASLNKMGEIFLKWEEIDKAISHFNRGLNFLKNSSLVNSNHRAEILSNLSKAYFKLEDYSKSYQLITESIDIWNEIPNNYELMKAYFKLILMTEELDIEHKTTYFFNKLKEINIDDSPLSNLIQKLAKGIILKGSNRMKNIVVAEAIFSDIVNADQVIDYELTLIALLNLYDSVLYDLKISKGDYSVLKELDSTIDNLCIKLKERKLYSMYIELLILKSKSKIIMREFNTANDFLKTALDCANSNNLTRMRNKIFLEIEEFERDSAHWMNFTVNHQNIVEWIRKTRIEEYLSEIAEKFKSDSI